LDWRFKRRLTPNCSYYVEGASLQTATLSTQVPLSWVMVLAVSKPELIYVKDALKRRILQVSVAVVRPLRGFAVRSREIMKRIARKMGRSAPMRPIIGLRCGFCQNADSPRIVSVEKAYMPFSLGAPGPISNDEIAFVDQFANSLSQRLWVMRRIRSFSSMDIICEEALLLPIPEPEDQAFITRSELVASISMRKRHLVY